MSRKNPLYESLVDITRDYLGPAGRRFIDRQIESHLDKEPSALAPQDLNRLSGWLRAAFSILTDDSSVIDEYLSRVKHIKSSSPTSNRR